MRLHGYCTGCHKIKRVLVTSGSFMFQKGMAYGLCEDCDKKQHGGCK
jgi:hypothetical protein